MLKSKGVRLFLPDGWDQFVHIYYCSLFASCVLLFVQFDFTKTGIPSVLLLLLSGIILREVLIYNNAIVSIPSYSVEVFGIIGLIMIVLEAGLDLQVSKKKLSLYEMLFISIVYPRILIICLFCIVVLYVAGRLSALFNLCDSAFCGKQRYCYSKYFSSRRK